MEEKYINLVKEAEDLFDKIIKETSFVRDNKAYESDPLIQKNRKMINVCLTDKT